MQARRKKKEKKAAKLKAMEERRKAKVRKRAIHHVAINSMMNASLRSLRSPFVAD